MDLVQSNACPDGSDLEGTHQPSRQAVGFYHRNGSVRNLLYYAMRFVLLALWALAHPHNKRDWRFAYAYFAYPAIFVGGWVLLTSLLIGFLFPFPWDWIGVFAWWCYVAGELYMFYIEGNAFQEFDRWIEHGGE
jgi:hypothetical protein